MFAFSRRALAAAIAAVALAACGGAQGDTNTETPAGVSLEEMSIGAADAPVTLVEYASTTCPACRFFHDNVGPTIKEYVEAGTVRWVFREFPTAPTNISVAGAVIARCAGEDKDFDVLDDLFENQPGILSAARNGSAETALRAVAARHGIDDARFDQCISNVELRRAIADVVSAGEAAGVTQTPTLFLNGVMLEGAQGRSPEDFRERVDALVAAQN